MRYAKADYGATLYGGNGQTDSGDCYSAIEKESAAWR